MTGTDPISRLNAALEGRYRIERQLGEGGMATVYLADDLRHERKVALKVLKPELAAVVGADRFLAEIKTTANLQHPHILPLFDSGEADGFLFYVMPYLEGESLRERLDREKQLPVDEAVQIAKNVAEALDYAHRHGVIHRDIKPANILLQDGKPVVSDFGIALAVTAGGAGRLTETGLSLGTPHYMSPEQATGDLSVGAATDIYALGCVVYEMLVAEPPYTGGTPQAVLGKIVTGDAEPVTKHRRSVPANVDATIRRSLEKVPADRFATAGDLVRALNDAGFRHGELAAGAGVAVARGGWNRLAVAMASVAAIMTAAFAWALLRPPPPLPVSRQYLDTEPWAGLEDLLGGLVAIAPDGSSTVLPLPATGQDYNYQLGLKPRSSTVITPIPGTEGARGVVFSPDGEWIAYAIDSDLFKRPLVGGSPLRIAEDAQGGTSALALTWLDDGTILYEQSGLAPGMSSLRLTRISEDGGEPLDVAFGKGEAQYSLLWAQGLPGARGALLVACNAVNACPANLTRLYVLDLNDGSSEILLEDVLRAWYTPTGHLVYVQTDGAVLAQPFDLSTLALSGPAVPLFDGVHATRGNSPIANAILGADGTLLYAEGSAPGAVSGNRLAVVDLEGNETVLPLTPRLINWVGWSPDGASVTYDDQSRVYTHNVAVGTTPRQITFDGTAAFGQFSPDGTRLAFSWVPEDSTLTGLATAGTDIFIKNLQDDSEPRLVTSLEGDQWLTQWPTDSLIAFEWGPRAESSSWDLGVLNIADPENPRARVYLSSEAQLRDLDISPDGRLAAYRSNETGVSEIYVRSFPNPGGQTRVSQNGGTAPFWSPDGNTLYYARQNGGNNYSFFAVHVQRDPAFVVLSTDSLFSGDYGGQPFSGAGLHPDGDRWILTKPAGIPVAALEDDRRLVLVENFFEELERLVPVD